MRTLEMMREHARKLSKRKPIRTIDFSWFSETENDMMVELFREIVARSCSQPLGIQRLSDGKRSSNEGPLNDFAITNDAGDDLFFSGSWYGGFPGDAYRQTFTLFCADGSIIETDVVDSCTQSSISFFLFAADEAARLDVLASAVTQAMNTYYQKTAERYQQKSEKSIQTLPRVGSFRFEVPLEMTRQSLLDRVAKHLVAWASCHGAVRVVRDNGDIAFLGQFLSQGLYAQTNGSMIVFDDASAVHLCPTEHLFVTIHAKNSRQTEHLQKFVPLGLQDEGLVLLP
jgi:hypothetical protein